MTFAKALALAGLGVLGVLLLDFRLPSRPVPPGPVPAPHAEAPKTSEPAILLSQTQVAPLKIEPVGEYVFPQEIQSVGTIDFNQELLTQVFTQFPGRIIKAFAKTGEIVKKGQALFSIDSPDLLQAQSTLISAAGVLDLTTRILERQSNLFKAVDFALI